MNLVCPVKQLEEQVEPAYAYSSLLFPIHIETYKPVTIPGVRPNMYEVSSYGNVRNIDRGKILKGTKNSGGYLTYRLQGTDKRKTIDGQILVAHEHIPMTEDDIANNRTHINHKNFVKTHNFKENLARVNPSENITHEKKYGDRKLKDDVVIKVKIGGHILRQGEDNGMAQFSNDQARQICDLICEGYTNEEICNEMGLDIEKDKGKLNSIRKGKTWKCISKDYDLPIEADC